MARSLSGDERRRPYFALHDSFCRANGLPVRVKGSGAHPDESLAKCTDINFSVLAIKYSPDAKVRQRKSLNCLTDDHIHERG